MSTNTHHRHQKTHWEAEPEAPGRAVDRGRYSEVQESNRSHQREQAQDGRSDAAVQHRLPDTRLPANTPVFREVCLFYIDMLLGIGFVLNCIFGVY